MNYPNDLNAEIFRQEPPARALSARLIVRRLVALGLTVSSLGVVALTIFVVWIPLPAPRLPAATHIYDAQGILVSTLFAENRVPVPLVELPQHLPLAILAIEDARFFDHEGIDPVAVVRALVKNLRARQVVQGGSTLTQQLAKTIYLYPDRTVQRKLVEALLAIKLDYMYDKRELLELYLNAIYLGHGRYGVEAASQYYFGQSARDVTLAEAALLAGIIRSPENYSPRNNPEAALHWRNLVLERMVELGWAEPIEARSARETSVELTTPPTPATQAPYFVQYVVSLLEERHPEWRGKLHTLGLEIYTTMNGRFQQAANEAVLTHIKPLQKLKEGVAQPQAAVVVLEPVKGDILAMVGGTDYAGTQLNRAVARPGRQPGSAFKPILYSAVLDHGYTLLDTQLCEPVTFQSGSEPYAPTDSGAEPYHNRPLTVRDSLVYSDNVTTVRWADALGASTVLQYARRMGVDSPMQPTLSMALGAYELPPLELARAYAALANGGWRVAPRAIVRVTDQSGVVLDGGQVPERRPVLSAEVAFLVTNALEDVLARGTAAHLASQLTRPAAVKTGTSQDRRDAWFAGYTPEAVGVVWVGEDTPQPLSGYGGTLAGPVWVDVMEQGLAGQPPLAFNRPPGVVQVTVCQSSGLLPDSYPDTYAEWFVKGTESSDPCPRATKNWWERIIDFFITEFHNRGR